MNSLTHKDIDSLNQWGNYLKFKETWLWHQLINCSADTLAIFAGNRFGKTAMFARSIVLRISGCHPVAECNFDYLTCNPEDVWGQESPAHRFSLLYRQVPHKKYGLIGDRCPVCGRPLAMYTDPCRIGRCASENLPGQSDDGKGGPSTETKNTQYPAIKNWLPQYLIAREITVRAPVLTITDPNGGPPIQIEFVSYGQTVQAQAGVPRKFIWMDEQPPYAFYAENWPRVLDTRGQIMIGLTPAESLTYLYDEIFSRARAYYRTKTIAKLLGSKQVEITDSTASIAVFQASTDDNPTLDKDFIESRFAEITDQDELLIRRHGIFRQVSGTVQKEYEPRIHRISAKKYFPDGVPHQWVHARLIDYHQRTPWAVLCVALSPDDECFAYLEMNPDPTRTTTYTVAKEMAEKCGDYKYSLDKIDPLADTVQGNTGRTTVQDLNEYLRNLKRDDRIGTGGFFTTWDTKGTRGREQTQLRIHNAKRCGVPFNNTIQENGKTIRLPTLWILDTCPITDKSLSRWRYEEWQSNDGTKEAKASTEQKFSHFPMCLEAIFKEAGFRPRARMWSPQSPVKEYFVGARL